MTVFEKLPDGSIQEIKSDETHKTNIDIWAPASKNNYFVRVSSNVFAPFISKEFKLGDEEQVRIDVVQHDISASISMEKDRKTAIVTFLLSHGWIKKNDEDRWHSPHDSFDDDDLEKAFFFQEYLLSQQHLTSNIEELNKIRETNPAAWEKYCWTAFQKTTREQWNRFVTEEIMEELDD